MFLNVSIVLSFISLNFRILPYPKCTLNPTFPAELFWGKEGWFQNQLIWQLQVFWLLCAHCKFLGDFSFFPKLAISVNSMSKYFKIYLIGVMVETSKSKMFELKTLKIIIVLKFCHFIIDKTSQYQYNIINIIFVITLKSGFGLSLFECTSNWEILN